MSCFSDFESNLVRKNWSHDGWEVPWHESKFTKKNRKERKMVFRKMYKKELENISYQKKCSATGRHLSERGIERNFKAGKLEKGNKFFQGKIQETNQIPRISVPTWGELFLHPVPANFKTKI